MSLLKDSTYKTTHKSKEKKVHIFFSFRFSIRYVWYSIDIFYFTQYITIYKKTLYKDEEILTILSQSMSISVTHVITKKKFSKNKYTYKDIKNNICLYFLLLSMKVL